MQQQVDGTGIRRTLISLRAHDTRALIPQSCDISSLLHFAIDPFLACAL